MNKTSQEIGSDLTKIVNGLVFSDLLHRIACSSDASIYQILPACVVVPRDIEDIVSVVKYAAENKIPIAPRGAGSGVAGESLCSGIVLDIRQFMNRIISSSDNGSSILCEPGAVLDDVNNYLAKFSRKIGPDPSTSNRAVVGGCIANNATGAHSLQFGYMADYIESIEAVLADGSVIEFTNNFDINLKNIGASFIGQKCHSLLEANQQVINSSLPKTRRNRCGYSIAGIFHDDKIDLARLFAGSEGTLAVFTKIKLRSVPVPSSKALLELQFDSLEKLAQAVPLIVQTGAAACEMMDSSLMALAAEAMPQYRDILPLTAKAVLLVEHTGAADEVREKNQQTSSIVRDLIISQREIFDSNQQKRLWKMRKDAVPLLDRKKGNKHPVPFVEDVSVDNTRLGEYINSIEKLGKKYDILLTYYGHAGDGLLHIRPYLDLSDPADIEKMKAVANEVFAIAHSLGGSISGEHAVGLVRAPFVKAQYGEKFYNVLCQIKNIFDPAGIINPGKIINPDSDVMAKNLKAAFRPSAQILKTDLLLSENELGLELDQCNGCALCLSNDSALRMCPVFRALDEELASSRAKASILRYWSTGRLSDEDFNSSDFKKILDLCINCNLCSAECPSGVDISKLVIVARTEYAKRMGLTKTEIALSKNRYLSKLGSTFAIISNFVTGLLPFKWILEKLAGFDRRRSLPAFAQGTFLKKARKYLASKGPVANPIDKVAYFCDTFVNYNDHTLGFAVLDVLRHNDIEVILPPQRPVPLPAICYGDIKTAKKDLQFIVNNLSDAVKKGYKIICSEPSAALYLKKELQYFVAGSDAQLVSENTFELTSYLLDLFKDGKLKKPSKKIDGTFAYHAPCHLLALGRAGDAIELLEKYCALKVIDLNAGCCGLAGTFGMQKKNYDLSEKISGNLRLALSQTKADTILTQCSACAMQIEHLVDKKTVHPIHILEDCYEIGIGKP